MHQLFHVACILKGKSLVRMQVYVAWRREKKIIPKFALASLPVDSLVLKIDQSLA